MVHTIKKKKKQNLPSNFKVTKKNVKKKIYRR